jgi:AcrR family transcriptional regulator
MEKRQSSHARKQQIVEAALAILNEQGVHKLTSMEIASRVGISDGTIFRHFPNKEAILLAAIDFIEGLLFQDFPPTEAEPLARLRTFFIRRLELLQQHPSIVHLAFSDRLAEAAGEEGAERVMSIVMRSFAFVRQCLAEAQEAGTVGSDLPPELLVWTVTGALQGVSAVMRRGLMSPAFLAPEAVWANVEKLLRRSVVA